MISGVLLTGVGSGVGTVSGVGAGVASSDGAGAAEGAAETAGEKGVLRFLDCLNGPSKYNAESAARICSQLARIHDM